MVALSGLLAVLALLIGAGQAHAGGGDGLYEPFPEPVPESRGKGYVRRVLSRPDRPNPRVSDRELREGRFVDDEERPAAGAGRARRPTSGRRGARGRRPGRVTPSPATTPLPPSATLKGPAEPGVASSRAGYDAGFGPSGGWPVLLGLIILLAVYLLRRPGPESSAASAPGARAATAAESAVAETKPGRQGS